MENSSRFGLPFSKRSLRAGAQHTELQVAMRMKQINPVDVDLIALNETTLTLTLRNDKILRFEYASPQAAASDLRQWQAAHFTDLIR